MPSSIDPILELLWDVRSYQEDDSVPVCIHCRYDAVLQTFYAEQTKHCGLDSTLAVTEGRLTLLEFKLVQSCRIQAPDPRLTFSS